MPAKETYSCRLVNPIDGRQRVLRIRQGASESLVAGAVREALAVPQAVSVFGLRNRQGVLFPLPLLAKAPAFFSRGSYELALKQKAGASGTSVVEQKTMSSHLGLRKASAREPASKRKRPEAGASATGLRSKSGKWSCH